MSWLARNHVYFAVLFFQLTKIVTSIGGGGRDRFAEAGLHLPSKALVRKDGYASSVTLQLAIHTHANRTPW